MQTEPQTPERSTYDRDLDRAMRQLRKTIKTNPEAKLALGKVETQLKRSLRVVHAWDDTHRLRVEQLLRLGQIAAANTAASLIFDPGLRSDLLARCPIGGDAGAAERVAEAQQLERMVIE